MARFWNSRRRKGGLEAEVRGEGEGDEEDDDEGEEDPGEEESPPHWRSRCWMSSWKSLEGRVDSLGRKEVGGGGGHLEENEMFGAEKSREKRVSREIMLYVLCFMLDGFEAEKALHSCPAIRYLSPHDGSYQTNSSQIHGRQSPPKATGTEGGEDVLWGHRRRRGKTQGFVFRGEREWREEAP